MTDDGFDAYLDDCDIYDEGVTEAARNSLQEVVDHYLEARLETIIARGDREGLVGHDRIPELELRALWGDR